MAIAPDDLKVLHSVLNQARSARRACQDAAEALSEAEAKLDGQQVTVDVPCTFCPQTIPVIVTVGSGTVPLRDVCPACARGSGD